MTTRTWRPLFVITESRWKPKIVASFVGTLCCCDVRGASAVPGPLGSLQPRKRFCEPDRVVRKISASPPPPFTVGDAVCLLSVAGWSSPFPISARLRLALLRRNDYYTRRFTVIVMVTFEPFVVFRSRSSIPNLLVLYSVYTVAARKREKTKPNGEKIERKKKPSSLHRG